jgi:hypothetical protein
MGMRKLTLVAGIAAIAVLAFSANALAANTSTLTPQLEPSAVPAGKPKGAGLMIESVTCFSTDTQCINSSGANPAVKPDGTDTFRLYSGAEAKFTKSQADKIGGDFPNGTSTQGAACNVLALAGQTTIKGATAVCNATQVGSGHATACVPAGPNAGDPCAVNLQIQVAAFRMADQAVSPNTSCVANTPTTTACTRLALYADGGIVLAGTINGIAGSDPLRKDEGFYSKLTIPVPNLGGPSLTDFWTNIGNGGLVRTACGKGTQPSTTTETVEFRAEWDVTGGGTNIDNENKTCQALVGP